MTEAKKIPADIKKMTLAACVDRLYKTREQRYALNRQVKVLEEEEGILKERLINELPKSEASGVAGRVARATITTKDVPVAKDWDSVYAWCLEDSAKHRRKKDGLEFAPFSIFQKRLSSEAVEERLDAGEEIKGIEIFTVKSVSLNKL